jgi:uncharacterized protein (TIGR02284 family)
MPLLAQISTIPPVILEKLRRLYKLLNEGKASYEKMAFKLEDKQLQRTIISLAQESNQYASEVSSQIHCLGGAFEETILTKSNHLEKEKNTIISDKESISEVCNMSEKKLLSFYKELLDEPYLFAGIRKMIQYQMNGFQYIISQLRLLQLTS